VDSPDSTIESVFSACRIGTLYFGFIVIFGSHSKMEYLRDVFTKNLKENYQIYIVEQVDKQLVVEPVETTIGLFGIAPLRPF